VKVLGWRKLHDHQHRVSFSVSGFLVLRARSTS
jgi:hypothetical protein